MKTSKTILMSVIAAAVIGTAGFALAQGGFGWDGHMGGGYHMGYGPNGSNAWTDEQRDAMYAAKEQFFSETGQLRNDIGQKRYELGSEMAKTSPDAARLKTIQKSISELEAQFDQKRLEHQLRMREIFPDNGRRGPGPGSGGYCWQ